MLYVVWYVWCFHGKVWSYVVMVWFVVPESGWWSMARPISCAQGFCWHPHPTTKAGNDVLVFRFLGTVGHSQVLLDGIPWDSFRRNYVREPDMRWRMTRWGPVQRSEGATTVDKFILWLEPFLFYSHSLFIFYSKRKFFALLRAGRDLQLHLHLPSPFGWRLSSTLFVYDFWLIANSIPAPPLTPQSSARKRRGLQY